MTYNIDWKSNNAESIPGKAPIILAERTVDTTSTSLALTGKGTANYGEMQQENFIRLLENFASNTAPANPTIGQLWFHPVDKALYLCVQTSTVVANTAVYYQSGVIGWVRVWESTELGTIVGDLEQAIVDAITAHVNAADPHPQYLTLAEGNLQYLQKTGGTLTGPLVLPSDASTALQAVPKQQMDAALTTHTNAADPHPQYLTQTEADGRYSLGSSTVNLTGNQTVAGTKTFSNTISGSVSGNAGTVTNGVYTTGDQTVGGVKTFSFSPIVPTPSFESNDASTANTSFVKSAIWEYSSRVFAEPIPYKLIDYSGGTNIWDTTNPATPRYYTATAAQMGSVREIVFFDAEATGITAGKRVKITINLKASQLGLDSDRGLLLFLIPKNNSGYNYNVTATRFIPASEYPQFVTANQFAVNQTYVLTAPTSETGVFAVGLYFAYETSPAEYITPDYSVVDGGGGSVSVEVLS